MYTAIVCGSQLTSKNISQFVKIAAKSWVGHTALARCYFVQGKSYKIMFFGMYWLLDKWTTCRLRPNCSPKPPQLSNPHLFKPTISLVNRVSLPPSPFSAAPWAVWCRFGTRSLLRSLVGPSLHCQRTRTRNISTNSSVCRWTPLRISRDQTAGTSMPDRYR